MARGQLRKASTVLAARHLHALLEAELLERFMFQHLPPPTASELTECADRAIAAFLRLYAPEP
ncbi:hypothetical protein D3C72_2224790 [compost metagenome]